MPRRKRSALPKKISINREPDILNSAYFLDLREKILPPPPSRWLPSQLDEILAKPWRIFKDKQNKFKNTLPEQPVQHWPELKTNMMDVAWPKAALAFACFCLVLILPLRAFSAYGELSQSRAQIIQVGEDAFSHLYAGSSAALSLDLTQAANDLAQAAKLFNQSQLEINKINPALRLILSVLPWLGDKYQSGQNLVLAGQDLTLAVQTAAQTLAQSPPQQSDGPVAFIQKIETVAGLVLPALTKANEHLAEVHETNLPLEQRAQFARAKNKLQTIVQNLATLPQLTAPLRELLGAGAKKRYLVVFQNNGEIRPTGGFMGSFAILDVKDGRIEKINMPGGGPFDLAGNLKISEKTPAPLQIMRTRWEMQDANWFADFPTSAKKVAWFYEKSGGPTVDGVVAIDATFFQELLKITGPIAMPEYDKTIDDQNFIAETQNQVEFEYDRKLNRPKQFLADLAPQVLTKLFEEKSNLLALLTLFQEMSRSKHWQIFSADNNLENFLVTQGLAGEIKNNPGADFLAVINTNIAGQKTDWVMEQSLTHQAQIADDGSIIDTVTIIRSHHGQEGQPLTGVQNVNYLRLYAPKGALLLTATGFKYPPEGSFKVPEKWFTNDADLANIEREEKIDEQTGTRITTEFDKTVFANWSMTKPGETSVLTMSYKLPFKVLNQGGPLLQDNISYSLLLQKQAGSGSDKFTSKIILPSGFQTVWRQGPGNSETVLKEDQFIGIVATR